MQKFNGNIEPGMLCVIVGYIKTPVNVGKVCTTIQLLQPGEIYVYGGKTRRYEDTENKGPAWLVEGENLTLRTRDNGSEVWVQKQANITLASPSNLMPIKPDKGIENEREQLAGRQGIGA